MPQDSHSHIDETPEGTHVVTRTETYVFVPNSSRSSIQKALRDPSLTMFFGLIIVGILALGYLAGQIDSRNGTTINNTIINKNE